jgi:hypothetical protein
MLKTLYARETAGPALSALFAGLTISIISPACHPAWNNTDRKTVIAAQGSGLALSQT